MNLAENLKIRTSKISDLSQLLDFEQGVITAERPFDTTLKEGRISYYDLEKIILADDAELVVAECDGKLIASGYAQIKQSKPYIKFSRFSYLGFMYVDPKYRGHGVNKLILEALKDWSKSKGIYNVSLDVYDQNQAAIRAYEKAGFKKNLVEMQIDLSND